MPSILADQSLPSNSVLAPTPSLTNAVPQQRAITDVEQTRRNIYDNVLTAVNSIGPLTNARHTLSLHDVRYIDKDDFGLREQKNAILTGKSLARRLRGTWRLQDNATGTILEEKPLTIAAVPHLTNRGTFINNGTDYVLSSQFRLRPGIFTRRKENGELESHVNVMPGNGISHRYFLQPDTGVFKINIGQAKLPLMPLLKTLGITDSELRESWGDEIVNANLQQGDGQAITKLYQRLIRKPEPGATPENKATALAELFHNMKLDPEVTSQTLGKPYTHLTKEAILDATKKLIRVSRNEDVPDDRDHLAFQNFHGPEDLMSERITKDKMFLRQLLWKASFKNNLSRIPSGVLTRQLNNTIMNTGLGQALEELNGLELLDSFTRTTRLGEGGIGSLDAIPESSRAVSPSQLGFVDPIKTAESAKVGIDSRISSIARKGTDGKLYTPMVNLKTGTTEYMTPQQLVNTPFAFPGELEKGKPYVAAMIGGATRFIDRDKVTHALPHMENAFSPLANLIPGKSSLKGQRMSMGARFYAQALPLVHREAPLFQSGMPGKHMQRSYEDEYGKYVGAIRSDVGGYVKSISSDEIVVKTDDGKLKTYELYNNFPYSRKTSVHNTALVKSGQRIEPDQLLAKSNFTDDNGTVAMGTNARVAFIPFKGANYEDASVISESYAKRLTSEHMYMHDQEWHDNVRKGLKPFVSLFPTTYTKQQLSNMDEHGVVKPGTILHYGDPVILVAQEKGQSYSQVHKGRKPTYSNNTVLWEHHSPGEVTDSAHTAKGVNVAIKAQMLMKVGDKLSGRNGGKGVVAEILPDDQMPHDEEGKPFDIALNPLGMISRVNPVQVAEMILGKIAKKTGKVYKIEDFSSVPDLVEFVADEMKKHGVADTETIIDPNTGRKIPNVLTGYQHMLKLHHTSESKGQGRGIGGYTQEDIPAKGGSEGSKIVGMLEANALISHGASEFARDAHLVRGQKNENYWQSFMSGFRPPDPDVPLIYKKFVDSLKASGVNVVRTGKQSHIMALTDKDVDQLAGDRNIENAETVDWKAGLQPKRGGLFATDIFGTNRWGAIKLHEPMPNPAFEEPIRQLLGLTQKKFENIVAGKEQIDNFGSGPAAIKAALSNINIDRSIAQAQAEIHGSKKGIRDNAVRKLAYLKSAKRLNLHPKEWVLSRVPVLPPVYRPVSVMQNTNNQLVSDPNYLYKELFDANQALKDLYDKVDDVSDERLNVYKAFKGVVGLGDPIQPKNQERQVKGILSHVFGTSPKFGMVQRQLLGAATDLVGRAVITPNPDLDIDQVGLPEEKAWEVYKPFTIRRLVQHGIPRLEAARMFRDKVPMARAALVAEMDERPVVISRAPVLHRYGIMAFRPKLMKGDVMQIPPLVAAGFGADHDGDAMNYHVPASDEAKKEALEKLLPSKNLFSISDFKVHYTPKQEYQGGLYHASTAKDDDRRSVVFRNKQDAINAYKDGRIDLRTRIEILQH